jgi:hypothetical protein
VKKHEKRGMRKSALFEHVGVGHVKKCTFLFFDKFRPRKLGEESMLKSEKLRRNLTQKSKIDFSQKPEKM